MRKAQLASLAIIGVLAGVLATVGGASHDGGGFDTSKPPYLVATAAGVEVDPIISTGDIVGDYQMSGRFPDGPRRLPGDRRPRRRQRRQPREAGAVCAR